MVKMNVVAEGMQATAWGGQTEPCLKKVSAVLSCVEMISKTSLLVADRNFRVAEFLEQEVRRLREEERQLRPSLAQTIREMRGAAEARVEIIRERQQVEAQVTELGSQLAAFKREAANCESSSREYLREADSLAREAADKRSEAGRLQEEVRRLQAQAQQFFPRY